MLLIALFLVGCRDSQEDNGVTVEKAPEEEEIDLEEDNGVPEPYTKAITAIMLAIGIWHINM